MVMVVVVSKWSPLPWSVIWAGFIRRQSWPPLRITDLSSPSGRSLDPDQPNCKPWRRE